ncbi:ATP-binding protein [Rhizobium leguminosarum]|uniref:Chromosome segregation protein SMC n=1 Tax=Rhizobium leguminosarum TaxID=384 RepID=A0A7M3DIT4_RHILE|nr:YhaN family protein [Rhizobium leguminosarum]TAY41483.1 chromosome segregation protein SMC [Rhizobium leguminosarum]
MRLTELTLERYGAFAERNLLIPSTVGLTIIYGPNEAGKSTCLAALSDFLFGIPERTPHATLFGYDGMRVGATLVDASGSATTLRRRRGRGRTLTDAGGAAVEDSVLVRLLGTTTRERFATLFGLNHETLRSGGSRLLSADGDIGRLIVEAGGGLRSLMARLDAIDAEADKLFALRRSADRTFYKALDAFDAADRDVKHHTVTRDAYEQSRKAADAGKVKLTQARTERQIVSAEISALERLVRAVPHMLDLDRVTLTLSDYVDIHSLPTDFDRQVNEAKQRRDAATVALADGRMKRDRLSLRLDALGVSETLINAEARVRDLLEQAIHVRKARADRANRLKDIEKAEAELATLRRMLHLTADADLVSRLPGQTALDQVQELATDAIERGAAIRAARERTADLADRLETLQHRLDAAVAAGYHKPVAFSAAQFTGLAAQAASAGVVRRQADQALATATSAIITLGFATPEALAGFGCPSADAVRAEQAACAELEATLANQGEQKADAENQAKAARETITRLEAAGPVASDVALADARNARASAWLPLRDAYLDANMPAHARDRRVGIDVYESHVTSADDLADRRAAEAQHAANLALARQQLASSTITIDGCSTLIADIGGRLDRHSIAFAQAFPDATVRFPQLAGLLDFVERREKAMDALAAARALATDAERLAADLEPLRILFESAQDVMKVTRSEGQAFAAEVQALAAALTQHETEHNDYRRDLRDSEALRPTTKRGEQDLADLLAQQQSWQQQWSAALSGLGLDTDLAPERAGALVSEWSGARATLGTISQTRTRLTRMDEDEATLKAAVLTLATSVDLVLPDDPLAATDQLAARWKEQDATRLQRVTLAPDVEDAKAECVAFETVDDEARAAVAALAASASVANEDDALLGIATRCAARARLLQEKDQVERSIADVSDGLGISELRTQWAGRDLDTLRGALVGAKERSEQLENEVEAAILAQKSAQDALDHYAAESAVNQAVAERESAAARMHAAVERYVDLTVARALVTKAIDRIRSEQQDPLVSRAGELFAFTTRGEFAGIETDIDDKGVPVVVGRRQSGATVSVATMSDGTRDQLFLAFRLASLENYAASTEPLPFVADDILVHFDDERSAATLDLLARFAETNQVLLFTHHKSVRDDALRLEEKGAAAIVEIGRLA